jgi:hypothetical protein
MKLITLLLFMIFCHILDDYYLQGCLASMKQRSWWENNYPDIKYKNDYIIALIEHSFSWTFTIHIPVLLYHNFIYLDIDTFVLVILFIVNIIIHAIVDNAKANLLKINLIQDQLIHIIQILITWIIYIN